MKQDLTKPLSNPERKALLEALKKELQPQLRLKPQLVVKQLMLKEGFAYLLGR